MDSTAQNSNVTDIWSATGQGNQQDDQNQPVLQGGQPASAGGSFSKPGLAGGGESGYVGEGQESQDKTQKPEADEKSQGLKVDQETLDLLEKARKREMDELAELHKPVERYKVGEVQKPQEALKSPEIAGSPEIPKSPEVQRSPEVQKSPELYRPEVGKTQKADASQSAKELPESPAPGKIVDKRTGKEKTHRVDINKADAVTKVADIKEQEFIERVDQEHVKSII